MTTENKRKTLSGRKTQVGKNISIIFELTKKLVTRQRERETEKEEEKIFNIPITCIMVTLISKWRGEEERDF